ncbi:rhodanese-like domain-containing protein [Sulfurospirillum sp. 1307]
MKKLIVLMMAVSVFLNANQLDLKGEGVKVKYFDFEENKKNITITRIQNEECRSVRVNPNTIWGGDFANASVPDKCKKTFTTTIGKLSPIKIDKDIETYGELEVIEFIKKAQNDENLLLIDARTLNWFLKSTIPGAINIPFKSFDPIKAPDEFEDVLDKIGVSVENSKYDFSHAKTLLLFCNGAWCLQSPAAIKNLIKIGYPKEKLLWYRGGMYNWTLAGLTTIKP